MNQFKNRIVSLMMALLMLVSCLPITATAEEIPQPGDTVSIMVATITDLWEDVNEMSDPGVADASPTVDKQEESELPDNTSEDETLLPGSGEYPHDPEPTEQPDTEQLVTDDEDAGMPATLAEMIKAEGYVYAMIWKDGSIYSDKAMRDDDRIYVTKAVGSVVLCTACAEDDWYEVWLMDSDRNTVTGYMDASCLDEYALTDEFVGILTQIEDSDEVQTPVGKRIIFYVRGDAISKTPATELQETGDSVPEDEPTDSADDIDLPAADDQQEDDLTEDEQIEDVQTEDVPADQVDELPQEEDLPVSEQPEQTDPEEEIDDSFLVVEDPEDWDAAKIGDLLSVSTDTRVFAKVDSTEKLNSGSWQGYFVKNAVVKLNGIQLDNIGRRWYQVEYRYGADLPGGGYAWTAADQMWVLADEVQPTNELDMTITDYAFKSKPSAHSSVMLMATTPMNGFSLKNISVNLGSFEAWQSGLNGSSGRDSDYPQIAKSAAHGNIYATPHYLEGYSVFCLEHNLSGPGEGSGSSMKPKGPYVLVDMDYFTSDPAAGGVSGVRYSASTMHAIGWVLRHTYPFMALDRSDSNNLVWSRVAGQFAIREVIKQLEGAQYVRDYWDMDNFYAFSGGAPSVYLDYARWLATNGIARARISGRITTSNVSVSVSGSSYIGSVTLSTDADLIRISKSVGTLTGNTGGADTNYYYAKNGDTIRVTSANSRFSISMESLSASDEEANFLIGIPSVQIQKILVPTHGAPPVMQTASVTFELSNGEIVVTKKSTDGILLPGTVFELLNSSGTVLKTATTDSTGKATFTGVNPGTYVVREKTPSQGYMLSTASSQNVTVTAGTTTTATFVNERISGKVKIIKKDSLTEKPLPGATFTVTRLSGPASDNASDIGRVVATITTNANGIAETGLLPWGQYKIEETGVPDGYLDAGYTTTIWIK